MYRFTLLIIIFFYSNSGQASVQTDTHTYIISKYENTVLVIDRKTDQELLLDVGKTPKQIAIHEGFGYVVNEDSHNVSVIDLKTHQIIRTIKVGTYPRSIMIYEELGYVMSFGPNKVFVIDLKSHQVIQEIEVGSSPKSLAINKGFGYVVGHSDGTVSVIDLKSHQVIQTIDVNSGPNQIAIHKGLGYVVNEQSDTVSVIDLKSQQVIQTIDVNSGPGQIAIHEGLGYVMNYRSANVSVIDLKSYQVIQTINVRAGPSQMAIHEGLGYIMCERSKKVSVVNLLSHNIIKEINNPNNRNIDFSDTHVYLGAEKIFPHPSVGLRLFKHPYTGLDGHMCDEDGEEDFNFFEHAALTKDYETAQVHFNMALARVHKKAYAVAFKAFCFGYWGAIQSDHWAGEFALHADLNYLKRIQNNPYAFTLTAMDTDTATEQPSLKTAQTRGSLEGPLQN